MLKKLMIGLAIITMLFIAGCSLDQAPLSPQEEEITPTQTQTDRYGPATRVKLWQATFNGTGLPGAWTFQTGGGGWGNN
ncbi:MAG: hypothetical protein JW969_18905, partial [Spirochaetales bacterium]|nr:hypothetical protein [Spirochaetales bacterium]